MTTATPRSIRIDDDEWARWQEAAQAGGTDVTAMIRGAMQAALDSKRPTRQRMKRGLKQARAELRHIEERLAEARDLIDLALDPDPSLEATPEITAE